MTGPDGWLDGRFVSAIRLPATDRGVLWGEGLFETVGLVAGRPFRLEAHLDRLAASVRALGLPAPGT
ncbi:MAG: aminotransferase class IV, partial [Acidobacteriota bacterium]